MGTVILTEPTEVTPTEPVVGTPPTEPVVGTPPADTPETPPVAAAGEPSHIETPEGTPGADPQWTPSFKYRVKDNEYDMPEWVQGLVKTPELEKEMKTIFSRGHGIEDIKTERQTLRDELAEVKTAKESIDQSLNTLSEYVQKGDMHSFFEALQIPKGVVLKYAVEQLKYQELPPEEKARIDNERQVSQQLSQLQYQNQTLQQQYEQQRIDYKTQELNSALSDSSVAPIVQNFDARNGAGAFQREVIQRGMIAYQTQGIDIPTKQAVDEVLRLLGAQGSSADPAAVQTPQQPMAGQPQQQKPIIPNVQGHGASPVRAQPTSLDDLRKLAEQAGA